MQSATFKDWECIALVHPDVKFDFGRVKRVCLAEPKKSWLKRLYYEYVVFNKISKSIRPQAWLSLHDLTPNVTAERRFVYCHNPAPFYRPSIRDVWLDPKFFVFTQLYRFFYSLNIDKNDTVIVQQQWLKDEFAKLTCAPIHVSHPEYLFPQQSTAATAQNDKLTFVYPAFPRVFKNHVVICEALGRLSADILTKIRVVFTLDGSENRYAAWLRKRYGRIGALEFRGRLSYQETQRLYETADCVLFPSRLETWGLPLTEAKHFNKNILAADLPYAKETLGPYANVQYLVADDADAWAEAIRSLLVQGATQTTPRPIEEISQPDTVGALALLSSILNPPPRPVDQK